jgi:hypothetical protein
MNKDKFNSVWAPVEETGKFDAAAAARTLGVDNSRALQMLVGDTLSAAARFNTPWTSHFMDLAFVSVVVGVALFGWFVYQRHPTTCVSCRAVIATPSGVKAMAVISGADLKAKAMADPIPPGAFAKVEDVAGRYAVRAMAKDEVITARDVSTAPLPERLAGRSQILLPVSAGPLANTLTFPAFVTLIATPKCGDKTAKPIVFDDVFIMAIDGAASPPGMVVALTGDEIQSITPVLGCAQFTVVKRIGCIGPGQGCVRK